MIDQPGIYKISAQEYHKDPVSLPSLSRSTIVDLLFKSAAHAKHSHPRLNPNFKESNDRKFDLGTAAHEILLEGGENICVIEAQDWRKKDTQEAREIALKEGKTPLLTKQYQQAVDMVSVAEKAIRECKELGITNLRNDGNSELSFIWKEEDSWCRCRPDWIAKDRKLILDYKTTDASANPANIARLIISMFYPLQAAMYSHGVNIIENTNPKFLFLFQETTEPYFCSFIGLSPELMEMGKQQFQYGLFLWRKCTRLDEWPSYPNRPCYIDAPPWALASWEQTASMLGEGE
jgi:hypothetical protein